MQAHKLPVTRTAHYYTLGTPGPKVSRLLIACHGYGQAASRFIHRFDELQDESTLIIAPEGLSRFYWGGFTGDIVSSWMTSGDRLDEIADYSNYLQQLYDVYVPQCAPDVHITLFGFSQGCATVVRWAMEKFPRFDRLILWAGMITEDIDYRPHLDYFSDKELHFYCGTNDKFITPERIDFVRNFVNTQGLSMQEHPFKGKHEVVREVVKEL